MKDFFTVLLRRLTSRNSPFRALIVPFCILVMFVLIFRVGFNSLSPDQLKQYANRSNLNLLVVLVGFTAAILPFIVRFLSSDKSYAVSEDDTALSSTKHIREELRLEKKLNDLITDSVTVEQIQDAVYEKTLLNIENTLLDKIQDKYEKFINFDLKHSLISNLLQPIIWDTEKYIFKLQRNSIVNLLIGIIGTITAITILAVTILGSSTPSTEIKDFMIHFLPRLTFVIFIQLFAFFFLRLYKSNLEDAKYFQNELTNLNSKTAALKIAHILDNKPKIDDLLKELSVTERNFKLFKEESTQHLEQAKLEKEVDINMLTAYREFLKIYKKEKKED